MDTSHGTHLQSSSSPASLNAFRVYIFTSMAPDNIKIITQKNYPTRSIILTRLKLSYVKLIYKLKVLINSKPYHKGVTLFQKGMLDETIFSAIVQRTYNKISIKSIYSLIQKMKHFEQRLLLSFPLILFSGYSFQVYIPCQERLFTCHIWSLLWMILTVQSQRCVVWYPSLVWWNPQD